ncbi:PH domain-containing protein [Methanomethylophilus alvi]|uniref:PH domain-containing protein n=1 Tax=Methanomethylophilus alvi TaxID=1291540 RepID=UPI0037DD10B5
MAPPVFYRHYRYLLDGEKIDVVCGVIFIRHTFVPIERVMQVEVTHGPINRMWGLADVVVTTAGGVAQIQYLEPDEAERVANDLGQIVNKVLRARGRA